MYALGAAAAMVALGACASRAMAPAAGPGAPERAPGPGALARPPETAESGWSKRWRSRAAWSEVRRSEQCLFLSGPAGLGLYASLEGDVAMEQTGEQLRVMFESGAEFQGRAQAGRLTLQRKSSYEHRKTPWTATERLEGELREGGLVARYHYEECDLSGKEGCPGRCEIEGRLELRGTTRPP